MATVIDFPNRFHRPNPRTIEEEGAWLAGNLAAVAETLPPGSPARREVEAALTRYEAALRGEERIPPAAAP
jgi:hypothetical protein